MILKVRHLIITAIILLTLILMLIPKVVFNDPESDILYSSEGKLLNARIADDGQWRFPESDSVPYKFKEALLTFEDKRFYYHPGIDILALLRAIKININNQRVSSGGSTITMQLVRMSRKNKPRTYNEKFIEVFIALRSELSYSKEKILSLYASHAPFGGNIVGLDAASWRYFGHPSADLSWAESALMAVLPNSPSMLHPGKNRDKLLNKRNKLLSRLKEKGIIHNCTYSP